MAALAVPAQAGAANVGVIGDMLVISGGSESSTLTVTRSGGSLVVADSTLTVSAGDHCAQGGDKKRAAVCSAAGINRAVAVMLDGNDALDWSAAAIPTSFHGGNGDDAAVGGTEVDSFDMGAGNDSIAARDGRAESVRCGAGADRGSADASDTVAADCESDVDWPGALVAPAPGVESPVDDPGSTDGAGAGDGSAVDGDAGADDAGAPFTIEAAPLLQATSKGDVQIGVSCTAASGDCAGSVEIVEDGGVVKSAARVVSARRGKRTKRVVLGRARFSVAAGETEAVTVRLSRAGRQRIIKKSKRRTRAKLAVTVVAPDGTKATTVKTVTIAIPKERRTSGRGKPKPRTKRSRAQ